MVSKQTFSQLQRHCFYSGWNSNHLDELTLKTPTTRNLHSPKMVRKATSGRSTVRFNPRPSSEICSSKWVSTTRTIDQILHKSWSTISQTTLKFILKKYSKKSWLLTRLLRAFWEMIWTHLLMKHVPIDSLLTTLTTQNRRKECASMTSNSINLDKSFWLKWLESTSSCVLNDVYKSIRLKSVQSRLITAQSVNRCLYKQLRNWPNYNFKSKTK